MVSHLNSDVGVEDPALDGGSHAYYQSCIRCIGAVVEGEYRAYKYYCYFSSEGELTDHSNGSHPNFQFALEEEIQLEVEGELGQKQSCEAYIDQFGRETAYFGYENS